MKEQGSTPSASQQLANELADSAVADHQRLRAERVPVPSTITRQRVVRVSLAVAIPILIAVLVATFAWQPLMSLLEPALSPAMASQQAQEILDALVIEIDAYRKDYDALPATLVDIGVPPRGQWSYVPSGNAQFKVQGTLYGQVVSFDSTSAAVRPTQERP
jgi:hypothetical protein